MAMGNETLFNRIFPAYFNAALKAHDRLRVEIGTGTNQEAALVFITEPIEDLMHISGYALIYSELDGKKYWDTVEKYWNGYIGNSDKPQERIEYINSTVKFRESVFTISPRDTLRTGWQLKLAERLRKENILQEIADYAPVFGNRVKPKPKPKHISKIIQIIARGTMGMLSYDGQDVFLAMYLANRPEAPDLELSHKAQSFLDSIKRLERNDQTEDDLE